MTESRSHIQALQTCEARKPRYPSKQRSIADPKLNTEPATNLIERLAVETVHSHATIHGWSVNPHEANRPSCNMFP